MYILVQWSLVRGKEKVIDSLHWAQSKVKRPGTGNETQ